MATIAVWVGLIAGGLYIIEFGAVRIVGPLRKRLGSRRTDRFWTVSRVSAPIPLVAAIAIPFVGAEGLKIGLAVVVVAAFCGVTVYEYRNWRKTVSERKNRRRRQHLLSQQGPVLNSKDQSGGVVNQINYPPAAPPPDAPRPRSGTGFLVTGKENTLTDCETFNMEVGFDDSGEGNRIIRGKAH